MTASVFRRPGAAALLWIRREWRDLVPITLGAIVVSVSYMAFLLPNRFPASGLNGLAVLSTYVWDISPSWIVGLGNALLLVFAWKALSPSFVIKTIYAVGLMTVLLKVFQGMPYPHLEERLLVALLAGILNGIGGGLVFRHGGCLGGTDVLVMVLRDRFGIEVGTFSFLLSSSVFVVALPVVGLANVIYGGVVLYVTGLAIDGVLRSFDRRSQVILITAIPTQVAEFVMKELHRGVTRIAGVGAYTGQERPILLCYLGPRQVVELRRFLAAHDPKSFMALSEAAEVRGRGFKSWKGL
ncbi:MAG TPA: YitT family protein [Synergistaceae bacterium]|nr:YitT family protein [Synergistaceae bacterium]HQF91460.1 YitT family protein [Synergistaceae bacterium]HQH78400.1 YitT family protein [Synergistaceae bacterium]HQK24946.1 YitT family protein [Synergistaceae bacterium]